MASIGTKVHMISSTKEEGFDAINSYLKPGITIAFIGQSGGGKSTLINKLIGKELQKLLKLEKWIRRELIRQLIENFLF